MITLIIIIIIILLLLSWRLFNGWYNPKMNSKGNETTVINCNLTRTDSWNSVSVTPTLYTFCDSVAEKKYWKRTDFITSLEWALKCSVFGNTHKRSGPSRHIGVENVPWRSHSLSRAPRSGSGERTVDILQYESELQNYFPWSSWCSARSCDSQFMNVSNVWHLLKNYLEQWHMGESLWVIFCENNRTRKRRTAHLL